MKSIMVGPTSRTLLFGVLAVLWSGCGDDPKPEAEGCSSDAQCAEGLHCQATLGTCHECTGPQHCGGGVCVSLMCINEDAGDVSPDVLPDTADVADDVADTADVSDATDVEDAPTDVPPDIVGQACDPACPGLQRCNDETERCEERALCLADADCIAERICFLNACADPNDVLAAGGCIGDDSCLNQGQRLRCEPSTHECQPLGLCRDSSECPGVLACTSDGLCVECISTAQCTGGLVCDDSPGANHCAEPGSCGGDADCRGDRLCMQGLCREPACGVDEFDDAASNDVCADASAIGEGAWELAICEGECDWFSIDVREGDGLIARVLHDPRLGDLDLELYQGDCGGDGPERIGRSATERPAEVVRIARSFEEATYRLRVCPFIQPGDEGTNLYRLDTVIVAGGFCVEDVYDANANNDTAARASNISVTDRPFEYEFDALQICPGSADWYRVELQAGDFLTVETEFLHRFGDLRLELYEGLPGEASRPVATSDGDGDGELVSLVVERSGEFYIHVLGNPEVQNEYSLTLRVGGGCVDAFEPAGAGNNTSQTATSLTGFLPGEFVGLRLCEDDEDWFVVDVPAGMAAVFNAQYDGNIGTEMEAEIFRDGMPATPVRGAGGALSAAAVAPEGGGEVMVRLFRDTEDDIIYTLRVELRDADDICEDPAGRDNYSFADAFDAQFGVREYLGTICPRATHYFRYSVPAGHRMSAGLLNVAEPGELEIEILGDDRRVLATGGPGEFGPVVTWTAQGATDVVVTVSGTGPSVASAYLLQAWSSPSGPDCGEDAFENFMGNDNDSWEFARLISGGTWIRNLVSCPADADWYKFFVISGSNVSVTIQAHTPTAGALSARIWDQDGPEFGMPVVSGSTSNGSLTLNVSSIDVLFGGNWSVEVFSESGQTVFYDVRVITN